MKMILVLSNCYKPSMPSWPEIMSVYGKLLPHRGNKITWVLPERVGMLAPVRKDTFYDCELYLIPLTKSKNSATLLLSTVMYQARLFLQLASLLHEDDYDVIQVRDDEMTCLNALIHKRLFNIRVAYNCSFPNYAAAMDKNGMSRLPISLLIHYKLMDLLFRKVILKRTDIVLPISNEMRADLIEQGVPASKLYTLPLGADLEIFNVSRTGTGIREKLGIGMDEFVMIYVGGIYEVRGLDVLVDSFYRVLSNGQSAKLVMVGEGDTLDILKRMVDERGIQKSVIFTGRVPYSEVPEYVAAADLGLSILKPVESHIVSSPCKLFEYMAMGKPVLANREIPEQYRAITGSGCGELVDFTAEDISRKMIHMIELHRGHRDVLHSMGERGLSWIIANRTFEKISLDIEGAYCDAI